MGRSVPSPLRAAVWWLLIFTPLSQQQQQQQTLPGRTDRAESHDTTGHEAEVAFWAQLIERVGCREVVVLDWFAFLAHRPTLGRQLFARLAETGHRLSVLRHLDPASPLRPPLHRLAILVPIVTQPSVHTDHTLGEFFQQLAHQSLFSEPYNWLFLISPEHEPFVRATLRRLPLRADSSVYSVIYRPTTPFRDDATGNLERKVIPTDRTVRRMQTIHPEVAGRTLVDLSAMPPTEPDRSGSRPSNVSGHTERTVQQLYRLQTRTQTIDVAVELTGMDDAGRLVLYGPRGVELRNDFFHLATIPIMVYTGAAGYVNSTLIAGSMPLFRNARTKIYYTSVLNRGTHLNYAEFFFKPLPLNNLRSETRGQYTYSLPIFSDHLYLFIQHAYIRYDERSSKILLVVLLPCCAIGALLCLLLLLTFNLMVDRGRVHPNGRKLTLADSLIWLIGVAAQQGSSVRPNSLSTMVLILVSLLFFAILYGTYVSHITSELSVNVAAQDLLEDLLEGNQYQIGFVENGTATLEFSVKNIDPALAEVMFRLDNDKTLYTISYEEGIKRMLEKKYGLIGPSAEVRKAVNNFHENASCTIREVHLTDTRENMAFEMHSNYAYRKMINYEILRCYSNGVTARLVTQVIPPKRSCEEVKLFHHITLSHITAHVLLLAVGAALAVLLLVLEFVVFYWGKIKHLFKQQEGAGKTN